MWATVFFIAMMMASAECDNLALQALWSGLWLVVMIMSSRKIQKEED